MTPLPESPFESASIPAAETVAGTPPCPPAPTATVNLSDPAGARSDVKPARVPAGTAAVVQPGCAPTAAVSNSAEFKVITDGSPNEIWACGFYGEHGRAKAQSMVDAGYWHRFMFACDKHKTLAVVEVLR